MARIHIGTSGYSYAHWKRAFYEGVPRKKWLEHYASVFGTVELNAPFYRLPEPSTVERWRDTTPAQFVFAAKGSRFLTHNKKLLDPELSLQRYFAPMRHLAPKLAVVVWQMPAHFKKPDAARLDHFLGALPKHMKGVRHAIELRDEAWYTDEICDVLDEHGAAFCEHDWVAARPPRFTGGFRYLRFHGASARYAGLYGREALEPVARSLRAWKRRRKDAFVYFNNDLQAHALLNALELLELVGEARPDVELRV